MEPAYVYRAYAERVHDGDTYQLRVDQGFDVAISIACRLRGVDTPELPTKEAKAARDYVATLLRPCNVRWDAAHAKPRPLLIQSYKDRRSFARWVCDVWVANETDDGWFSLAEDLLAGGLARPLIIP